MNERHLIPGPIPGMFMEADAVGDAVNHPAHYADKEIEVIDYIRDTLTQEEFVGYCIGNALKYLSRWRKKGGVEDLEKGAVYLGWAIQREKGQEIDKNDC